MQFDEKISYLVHVEKRAVTKKIVIIFKKKMGIKEKDALSAESIQNPRVQINFI